MCRIHFDTLLTEFAEILKQVHKITTALGFQSRSRTKLAPDVKGYNPGAKIL